MTNEEIVRRIYKNLLNREPDAGGLETYINVLSSGRTESFVENCILESDEYKKLQLLKTRNNSSETLDPNFKIVLYDLYLSRKSLCTPCTIEINFHVQLNNLNNIHSLCKHLSDDYVSKIRIYNPLSYDVLVENIEIVNISLERCDLLSKKGMHVCLNNNFSDFSPLVLHNLWDITHFEKLCKNQIIDLETKLVSHHSCEHFLWHG